MDELKTARNQKGKTSKGTMPRGNPPKKKMKQNSLFLDSEYGWWWVESTETFVTNCPEENEN